MTVVVLALDALDAGLVDYYECGGLHLTTAGEFESFANMYRTPFTLEVWPTVATGLPPEDHGVTGAGTSSWDNPLVDFASKFTGTFKENTRSKLGDYMEDLFGAQYTPARTDRPTMFDGEYRYVRNWPGVVERRDLVDVWDVMNLANDGEITREEFDRRIRLKAAEQLAWVREMLNHSAEVVGVHVHLPDAVGHPYSTDEFESDLGSHYKWLETRILEMIEDLEADDVLLLLSDHGMKVAWLGDDNPGEHSWRAFVASTVGTVPESVFDVNEWVEDHVTPVQRSESEIEMPEETLRDLGYLE